MLGSLSNIVAKKNFAVVHPILVCTYTNVAVDNLVEGFVNAGLDPVRIGYGQTKSTLQEHSLESKVEKHPLYPSYKVACENLKTLEKELKRTHARIFERQKQGASSNELSRSRNYLGTLRAKRLKLHSKEQKLYRQMQIEVLTNADVVGFSIPYTYRELTNSVRYVLLASVLGLGHWTLWTFLWSSWTRLRCLRNLLPSFLS